MRDTFLLSVRRKAAPLALAAGLLASSYSAVLARDLDPDLRQYVIVSCSQDAYRLCPQSLSNEKDAVLCMRSKRSQLDQICRVAYEKAVRVLAQ